MKLKKLCEKHFIKKEKLDDAIRTFAISRGYSLRTFVSDCSRIIYSCIDKESYFAIHCTKSKKELGTYHKTLNSIVTRLIVRVKNPKVNCIAKRILSIIQNIDVSIRSLINESEREFNVDISYKTMWRAKEKVLLKVNNHSHDLQLLEHYISELNNQNPGSWRSFEVDDNGRFLRAGISLKSWDESFKYSQNTIFIDGRSVVIVIVIVIIIIKEFCCQLSH